MRSLSQWLLPKQVKSFASKAVITLGSFVGVTLLGATGIFQTLEFSIHDQLIKRRPSEPLDPRIVVVTIDETDLQQLKQWPMSDGQLARLLQIISAAQPRIIGLDIYRDFPIEPGHQDLVKVFNSLSTVIGVEKVGGVQVQPPPLLAEQDQVAFADLPLDFDTTVRRALLAIEKDNNQLIFGLGTTLALKYLEDEGVTPNDLNSGGTVVQLGKSRLVPLSTNWGGYIDLDDAGYQIFLNYRMAENFFETVSLTDTLNNKAPENLFKDKIILIGATAPSLNDYFKSPFNYQSGYGSNRMPGVFIHAHITSQIISAALDDRPLIRGFPEYVEWLWSLLWIGLGTMLPILAFGNTRGNKKFAIIQLIIFSCLLFIGQLIGVYILLLRGWWMPTVPSLVGIILSSSLSLASSNQELSKFAYIDALTRIPNRRAYEEHFNKNRRQGRQVGLIICDVDFFKGYNDTYGHQAGDICLQRVAHAIFSSVRRKDLAARYGGEEFVVLVHDASEDIVLEVAERMREQVQKMKLEHKASKVCPHVTISCGAFSFQDDGKSPLKELLEIADKGLYQAKESGRNRVCQFNPKNNR